MMRPSSGRDWTCDCCKDVSNLVFDKILDMKGVGIAIYRYLPQAENADQHGTENGQVFILQNTGDGDVKLEELILESGKKKVSCPRCIKTIQHVKNLLKELPPVNIREVTGICDHCHQREFFNCPCCRKIVNKFLKFMGETKQTEEERERNKSWLIKSQLLLQKSFTNVKESKQEPCARPEGTRSEGRIHASQIPTSRYTSTKKIAQESAIFLEKYVKHRFKGESEPINEEKKYQLAEDILEKPLRVISFLDFTEEDVKPKPTKKEKTGILKSREDKTPGDIIDENKKLLVSLPKRYSFETVMKSLSEPNVSDFSYTFPGEKNLIKKQMKRQLSSSELIKYTQDMLEEREVEEKKKKAEIKRLKEKKNRLAEEERKKREEEKEIKDTITELEAEGEERDKTTKRKKPGGEDGQKGRKDQVIQSEKLYKNDKDGDEKQLDIAATSALKDQVTKQAKEKSEEEKLRKQHEKNMALGEKRAREAEKALEDKEKQQPTEKKRKEGLLDVDDGIKKGGKDQDIKSEKVDKKDKARQEKPLDHATSALKDQVAKQAKEKSEEEKIRKQQERDVALAEKKAKDAQKAIEDKKKPLTTEKKINPPEVKDDKGDKGKSEKLEKPVKEQKAKDDTRGEMAALLRDQLAKQKQQELEKEKLRKEQQKERELAEKKLKELQTKKEEKEPAIKPPTILLKPDEISEDEDVLEDILKPEEVTDVIKGQKIFKVKGMKTAVEKQLILEAEEPNQKTDKEEPELFKPNTELSAKPLEQFSEHKSMISQSAQKDKKLKPPDPEASKGIIRYTLSDRSFIDKGWTMLPTEKVVRKMNVYRMRPAKPEFDWFEHNKYKREMTYDSGEKLAEFDDNGRGRWYYRSGELALDYYDAEETNAGQRFVVYSTGQPDERGRSRPRTILATFDYSGNGIVFDHTGKIRLKYNQTEGVVLDRTIGPVSHWKWHTLNDPPVLQQVMIDTQMPYKDPTILKMGDKNADQKRPDNEEMIAIEFENFLKEKRQKLTQSFKPFQIKMKAMKINENFSLRVLDQASVYLLFRDGTTNLKINLGMVLDHKEIVDTDTAEIGEVSNTLDKLPACTDSIAGLQKDVAQAQAAERMRVRHERRLKQPQETASVDALRAGCSRPPRTPILQTSLTSCEKMTPKRFKPSCCNLYYSTQLY